MDAHAEGDHIQNSFRCVAGRVCMIDRIILAVRKHVLAENAHASACVLIRVDESACGGIVIAGV